MLVVSANINLLFKYLSFLLFWLLSCKEINQEPKILVIKGELKVIKSNFIACNNLSNVRASLLKKIGIVIACPFGDSMKLEKFNFNLRKKNIQNIHWPNGFSSSITELDSNSFLIQGYGRDIPLKQKLSNNKYYPFSTYATFIDINLNPKQAIMTKETYYYLPASSPRKNLYVVNKLTMKNQPIKELIRKINLDGSVRQKYFFGLSFYVNWFFDSNHLTFASGSDDFIILSPYKVDEPMGADRLFIRQFLYGVSFKTGKIRLIRDLRSDFVDLIYRKDSRSLIRVGVELKSISVLNRSIIMHLNFELISHDSDVRRKRKFIEYLGYYSLDTPHTPYFIKIGEKFEGIDFLGKFKSYLYFGKRIIRKEIKGYQILKVEQIIDSLNN